MKILDIPQSGSVGGVVSSRNTFGQYRRNRSSPAQPNTEAQVAARAALTSWAAKWRTLTDNERTSWDSYGNTITRYDSLGQAYKLTGFQAYVGAQTLRDRMSETQKVSVPVGPAPSNPGTSISVLIDDTPVWTVTVLGIATSGDIRYEVSASGPMSQGRAFNGDYRFVKRGSGTALLAGLACVNEYSDKWGVPAVGQRVFVKVACVFDGVVWWSLTTSGVCTAS